MKIQGPGFRLWLAPDISVEKRAEAAHALFRILIDPPRPEVELRNVAVRALMNLYEGSPSRRAKELERQYRAYLASAWRLERDLEMLPDPRTASRVLMHRIARLNDGASLGWRTIYDIAC